MTFKKGQSGNPAGKPIGIPNKATTDFKEALNSLLQECSPQILGWLQEVAAEDPAKALDSLCRLAEYVYPKLGRTVVAGDKDNPITVGGAGALTPAERAVLDHMKEKLLFEMMQEDAAK